MLKFSSERAKIGFGYVHPVFKGSISLFLDEVVSLGYEVIVVSSFRCFSDEYKIANQSNSFHCWGLAVDINVRLPKCGKIMSMDVSTKGLWLSSGIVELAKSKYKLFWGGDLTGRWSNDLVHFDARYYLKSGVSSIREAHKKVVSLYPDYLSRDLSKWGMVKGYLEYFSILNDYVKDLSYKI